MNPQVWPFFLWSVFVIVINAVEYELLASMGSSLSLLNIVNFLLLRHHLVFFFSQVGPSFRYRLFTVTGLAPAPCLYIA